MKLLQNFSSLKLLCKMLFFDSYRKKWPKMSDSIRRNFNNDFNNSVLFPLEVRQHRKEFWYHTNWQLLDLKCEYSKL